MHRAICGTAKRPRRAAGIGRGRIAPAIPTVLGISRTLVGPREHTKIGTMQYAETLPLRDHEVVLTFDDGPLPHNSDQVLAILASECIKATFFTIGEMARKLSGRRPQTARRRPDHRDPYPDPSADHEQDADRARQSADRRRHRLGEGSTWRRRRQIAGAVLPHSRLDARRSRRGLSGLAGHPDLERRSSRPTTGGIFRRSGLR